MNNSRTPRFRNNGNFDSAMWLFNSEVDLDERLEARAAARVRQTFRMNAK